MLAVGEPDLDELYDAMRRVEQSLRREVNVTTMTSERWDAVDDPFVETVRARPWVDLAVDTRGVYDVAAGQGSHRSASEPQ